MRSQVNSVSSCQVAAAVVLLSQMMDIGYCDDLERGVVELWHDGIKATVQQIGPDPLPFQGVTLEVRYRNTAAKPVPHPALSGENVLYWGQTPGFEMRAGVFRNKQLLIKDAGLFRGLPFCESKELEPVDGLFEADLFRLPGMITLFSNTKVIGYKPAYDRENLEWTLPPNGEFVCRMVILEEQMTARWSLKPEFLFPIPGEYQLRLRDLWNVKTGFQRKVSVAPALTVRVAEPVLRPDRQVYGILKRNPELSVAIAPMDGIRQATGARELIWDLIGDYDDSSYMDYIRFASARYWLFEQAKLPDNQLDPLKGVPAERLAFALGDLNEIDLKRFAFAPHALVLKRMVLEASGEKEKAATVAKQLDKQFPHHFTRYQDLIRRYPKRDWPGPRNPYLVVAKSTKKTK